MYTQEKLWANISMLAIALAMVFAVASADAADIRYELSGEWSDTTNATGTNGWQGAALPGAADTGIINWTNNTVTVSTVTPEAEEVQVGQDEPGNLVVESGGDLNVGFRLYAGHSNATDPSTLTVESGGNVDVGEIFWVAGDAGASPEAIVGVCTIEAGGVINVGSHLWWAPGAGGDATVNIYGTLNQTAGILGLGTINASTASGGVATVNIYASGILGLNNISGSGNSIFPGSVVNLYGTGVITLPGDKTGAIDNYVADGYIVAEDGDGTVLVTFDADVTTVGVADVSGEGEGEGEGVPEEGIIIASTPFPAIGQPLTLTAPAGASAPYQWYKLDGVEPVAITGATKATLGFPLIGTANYGGSSDTVRISSGTYSEDSIAFDGGADEYLPTSDGGYQVFSGDDDAWTFEATFTDGGLGSLPEIGVTRGSGGYLELYVNFYYEYVYAWAGGGVLSGSYITIDGTEAITVRMEASATEIACSADSTTTGEVALGNYTRGDDGDYTPWIYECYGGDYDFEVSDMTMTGYGIDSVNPDEGLPAEDVGIYALTYDDGAKATAWAYYDLSDPFAVDSEVPLASLVGLGLLAGAGLVGGMLRNRKK